MNLMEQTSLDTLLQQKESTTEKLNKSLFDLSKLKNDYENEANELWVNTKFNEVIEDGRPTVDMKKAYIDFKLKKSLSKIKVEETNIEVLQNELKVIDAKIRAEMKYLDVFCKINLEEEC